MLLILLFIAFVGLLGVFAMFGDRIERAIQRHVAKRSANVTPIDRKRRRS